MGALETAEEWRRRWQESGLSKRAFADQSGGEITRPYLHKQVRIAEKLVPETKALVRGKRWVGVRVLDKLAGLAPKAQVEKVMELAEVDPESDGAALAMLGTREPIYDLSRRRRILDRAEEARRTGELGDRRGGSANGIIAVLDEMVSDPRKPAAELRDKRRSRRRHSGDDIIRAEKWLRAEGLDKLLAVPLPPNLVAWLREELGRRWPELAAAGRVDDATVQRLVKEAGADQAYLEDALRVAQFPIREEYRYDDPIECLFRLLRGMVRPRLKAAATLSRKGGYFKGNLPRITWMPRRVKRSKVPRRLTRWSDDD